jgi:hypothetical protein
MIAVNRLSNCERTAPTSTSAHLTARLTSTSCDGSNATSPARSTRSSSRTSPPAPSNEPLDTYRSFWLALRQQRRASTKPRLRRSPQPVHNRICDVSTPPPDDARGLARLVPASEVRDHRDGGHADIRHTLELIARRSRLARGPRHGVRRVPRGARAGRARLCGWRAREPAATADPAAGLRSRRSSWAPPDLEQRNPRPTTRRLSERSGGTTVTAIPTSTCRARAPGERSPGGMG